MSHPDDVLSILCSGQFERLLGLAESQHVEFKLRWDLESRRDVRSMAADVAALANGGGGIIVLGVRAQQDPASRVERAAEVAGMPPDTTLTGERLRKLIAQHCVPLVHVEYSAHEGLCDERSIVLGSLVVEAQDPLHSPVLAQRLVDPDDSRVSDALGWPIRHGDGTEWVPAPRLQQLVSTGLSIERHLARLGSRSDSEFLDAATNESPGLAVLDRVLDDHEITTYITLLLAPSAPTRIVDFYGDFADAVRRWQPVRPMGFGRWSPVEPIDGCLAGLDARRSLAIGPDGSVAALAAGTSDFLGWGNSESGGPITINAYPLVEFVSEVIRLAYGVVRPAAAVPEFHLTLTGRGLSGTKLDVMPGRVHFASRPTAMSDSVEVQEQGTADWDADAFRLLASFMQDAFALPRRDVPWQRDERIDLALLG